ncbi:hemerythrin domain-containing protein [Pasteurella oralis]|uniref:hemerythrin domain-containing protein n=1 Tax=Pasteurella oralis TaxID=1071947 RepID=UPI000C7A8536|nr:hemerythrin domain-containing protein [Pasteurella oralis]
MLNLSPQQFVTWEQPIEMLYACHSKVKRFCHQLSILPNYLAEHGCNQAVKNDVQQILTYFNQSAPLHHQDEEDDFFPALLAKAPQVRSEIEKLAAQHSLLHQNWAELSVQLSAFLSNQRANIDVELISKFIASYDEHIAIEEPLFELGKQYLSIEELNSMGKIMFARRCVK